MKYYLFAILYIIIINSSQSQCDSICNKIVGTNLIVNGDFEKGDTGFDASPYTYFTSSPMTQGEYCITANPGSIHFAYSGTDHTSGSGKMMVVNGQNAFRGKFYKQTVSVNKYTCYRITVWLNNIVSSSYTGTPDAYIRFNINKDSSYSVVHLQQFPDQWVKMETTYYSDTNSKIILQLDDTSTAGNGNDFAIDDVSIFQCQCTSGGNNNFVTNDTTICSLDSLQIIDTNYLSRIKVVSGDTTTTIQRFMKFKKTSMVVYIDTFNQYCFYSDTIIINVLSYPQKGQFPDTSICTGESIRLRVDSGYRYTWTGAGFISSDTIFNPLVQPSSATAYIATISNGICVVKDTINISLRSGLPGINIGKYLCLGDTAHLVSTGGNSYQWSPGYLTNDSLNDSVSFVPSSNNLLVCKKTSVSGCIGYDSFFVYVDNVTLEAGSDTTLCKNTSITLNGTANNSLYWSPGKDFNDSTQLNPVLSPKTSGWYYLTVTGPNGCKKRDSLFVTVNTVSVNAGSDVTLCSGDSASLNATGATQYLWYPSQYVSTDTISNPFVYAQSSGWLYVKGTDVIGCWEIDSLYLTVSNSQVNAGADSVFCTNDSIQLNATGVQQYIWTPATGLSDPNIANPKMYINSATTYIVQGTDNSGCITYDTVNYNISTKGTAIACADQEICRGEIVTLSVNGSGSYRWSNGSTDSVQRLIPLNTTDYFVYSEPLGFCRSDTDWVRVTVNPKPFVSLFASPTEGPSPLNVSFNNNTMGTTFSHWSFGDGDTSDLQNPSHTYTGTGSFRATLKVVNQFGCSDTSGITIYMRDSMVLVFPNSFTPNGNNKNDVFEIYFDPGIVKEGSIKVYNRWGEEIYVSDLRDYKPWDGTYRGKPVMHGAYLFVFYLVDIHKREFMKTGLVYVLK